MLPRGRLFSRVWERTRDADPVADPHMAACPCCRGTAEGLASVGGAARTLCAEVPPRLQTTGGPGPRGPDRPLLRHRRTGR
ncbi:hypothetical protein GCM10018782_32910 [Streptomyces griseoaurantiacus]|nr:hypothetical protein GCM10018782_32910 [Streptomyces griseoaurantiacus]